MASEPQFHPSLAWEGIIPLICQCAGVGLLHRMVSTLDLYAAGGGDLIGAGTVVRSASSSNAIATNANHYYQHQQQHQHQQYQQQQQTFSPSSSSSIHQQSTPSHSPPNGISAGAAGGGVSASQHTRKSSSWRVWANKQQPQPSTTPLDRQRSSSSNAWTGNADKCQCWRTPVFVFGTGSLLVLICGLMLLVGNSLLLAWRIINSIDQSLSYAASNESSVGMFWMDLCYFPLIACGFVVLHSGLWWGQSIMAGHTMPSAESRVMAVCFVISLFANASFIINQFAPSEWNSRCWLVAPLTAYFVYREAVTFMLLQQAIFLERRLTQWLLGVQLALLVPSFVAVSLAQLYFDDSQALQYSLIAISTLMELLWVASCFILSAYTVKQLTVDGASADYDEIPGLLIDHQQ